MCQAGVRQASGSGIGSDEAVATSRDAALRGHAARGGRERGGVRRTTQPTDRVRIAILTRLASSGKLAPPEYGFNGYSPVARRDNLVFKAAMAASVCSKVDFFDGSASVEEGYLADPSSVITCRFKPASILMWMWPWLLQPRLRVRGVHPALCLSGLHVRISS